MYREFYRIPSSEGFFKKVRKKKNKQGEQKIIYTHKHAAKNVLCAKKRQMEKQQKQIEFDNQRRKYKQRKRAN